MTTDNIVLSINRDLKDWQSFLKSDALSQSSSEDLLLLVVQVLGEKVCNGDTILEQQQFNVVLAAMTEKFFNCVNKKCNKISFGETPSPYFHP